MPRKQIGLLKIDPEVLAQVVGRWKVESVEYRTTDSDESSCSDSDASASAASRPQTNRVSDELKDVEFTLDQYYDVTWHLPVGMEVIPLFRTTCFDVDGDELELMGSPDGRIFLLDIEHDGKRVGLRSTSSSGVEMIIWVKRMPMLFPSALSDFSLLDALKEGYFSDLSVQSCDGKQASVHRTVLSAVCRSVRYRDWELFLSDLTSPAFQAALHYVYTAALPPDLAVDVAKEVLQHCQRNSKFSHLKELCVVFVENHTLKLRLQEVVDLLVKMLETAQQMVEVTDMADPAKVVYTVRQLAKLAAVGVGRFLLLCQLFTGNKQEMTNHEQKEVLEYVQARVVVFIDKAKELLETSMAKWESLDDIQKVDIAVYVIPEVERIWGIVNVHAQDIHTSLGQAMKDKIKPPRLQWKVSLALLFSSWKKDVKKLKKLYQELDEFVTVKEEKRDWFMGLSEAEKAEKIMHVISETAEDGEAMARRLEDWKKKILVGNQLDWTNFKSAVTFVCSYVAWGMNKVLLLKDQLKPLAQKLHRFVQQEELAAMLVQLKLVEPEDLPPPVEGQQRSLTSTTFLSPRKDVKMNPLAQGCYHLLQSQELADMQFVLVNPTDTSPASDPARNPLSEPPSDVILRGHRVVLAARSEWFRRALQSGMVEDRDRRVVVQDIEESLFRLFLDYIYGVHLNLGAMTVQEVVELLAVADRYETSSLHHLCQEELAERVTSETVFLLLMVADRFSIQQLREQTMRFILADPELVITQLDGYSTLPPDLQSDVRLLLSGTQDPKFIMGCQKPNTKGSTPLAVAEKSKVVKPHTSGSTSSDDSTDDNLLDVLDPPIEAALVQLRAILGDEPSEEKLRSMLLAADNDVNRAVNFFFGTQ